jgi:hypothetical protein
VCRKLQFLAHLQVDRRDNGAAAEDWTGGVQKTLFGCEEGPSDEQGGITETALLQPLDLRFGT